jgi:hypothetical protein
MRAGEIVLWREGATFVAVAADATGASGLIVTNDGELWSAKRSRNLDLFVALAAARGVKRKVAIRETTIEPEWRLPLAWARRQRLAPGGVESRPAAQTAASVSMERAGGGAPVRYVGFGAYRKRSAHTLRALHRMVESALAKCERAWGWRCDGLVVKFHDDPRHFGLAYGAGSGALTGERRISLSAPLVERYTLASIERTVLHELAHHYREERWPRARDAEREAHDARFCDALVQVDPLVDGGDRCERFSEFADPGLVATAMERRRAARERAAARPPVWSPDAGELVLDHDDRRRPRLSWEPLPGFRWPRWRAQLTDEALLEVLQRFAPEDWPRVRARVHEWSGRGGVLPPGSLAELLRLMRRHYLGDLPRVEAYLGDLGWNE